MKSPYCVFVSGCMIAQTLRAEGCEVAPAIIKEVVQILMNNNINIFPMKCPETAMLGLDRQHHGKKWYDNDNFRWICEGIAKAEVDFMLQLVERNRIIIGIIGIEFSPACSTIKDSKSVYRQYGIYMEELENVLKDRELDIPMISITPKYEMQLIGQINKLIENGKREFEKRKLAAEKEFNQKLGIV